MSTTSPPPLFSKLVLGTLGVTFSLILLGAVVRITGSGMGCPDWPLCYGSWLPPMTMEGILEWVHRLVGALVSKMTLILLIWVALNKTLRARVGGWSLALLGCLASQIALGAYTVMVSNEAVSVGLHLTMAYFFMGCLFSIWRLTRPGQPEAQATQPGLMRGASLVTLLVFLAQAFIGALVAASHSGQVCPDFPTCHGSLFPEMVGGILFQMTHRYGALALLLAAGGLYWASEKHGAPALRFWPRLVLGIYGVQALIGIGAVLVSFSLPVRTLHQAGAATLFLALWAVTHDAWRRRPGLSDTREKQPEPALTA